MSNKSRFLVSALRRDSNPLGNLVVHKTEREAIDAAKSIMEMRENKSEPYMDFYILRVTAKVGKVSSPVKVIRY